jgi:SAM-dependent methyltransferase
MHSTETASLQRYGEALQKMGHRPGNVHFYMRYLFDGVDLRGTRVLDVGAGDGRFSFYAACAGATEVVGLEPDMAGSSDEANMTSAAFQRMSDLVGVPGVRLVRQTLQEFEHGGEPFDVVLVHAAVNHLDEELVVRLHEDAAARAEYARIFTQMAGLMKPGGALIIADAARRNLFGDLRRPNPIARTIEWHKHQQPELWAEILTTSGFVAPRIRWSTFNILRGPGRVLLGNRVAAYLTYSGFVLTMRRGPAPSRPRSDAA